MSDDCEHVGCRVEGNGEAEGVGLWVYFYGRGSCGVSDHNGQHGLDYWVYGAGLWVAGSRALLRFGV